MEDKPKKVIHSTYSNIPCVGKDCAYWGGEYEDVKEYDGHQSLFGRWVEPFTSVWHGEHCNRCNELAEMRKEIYDRADKEAIKCYESGKYQKPWVQAGKAFDKVADEWRYMKCPFYTKKENDEKIENS